MNVIVNQFAPEFKAVMKEMKSSFPLPTIVEATPEMFRKKCTYKKLTGVKETYTSEFDISVLEGGFRSLALNNNFAAVDWVLQQGDLSVAFNKDAVFRRCCTSGKLDMAEHLLALDMSDERTEVLYNTVFQKMHLPSAKCLYNLNQDQFLEHAQRYIAENTKRIISSKFVIFLLSIDTSAAVATYLYKEIVDRYLTPAAQFLLEVNAEEFSEYMKTRRQTQKRKTWFSDLQK